MANWMGRSRAFNVRRQAGFVFVALTCFLLLYLPIMFELQYDFS